MEEYKQFHLVWLPGTQIDRKTARGIIHGQRFHGMGIAPFQNSTFPRADLLSLAFRSNCRNHFGAIKQNQRDMSISILA